MIRCCLCRQLAAPRRAPNFMEPTTLPGTGYRCIDHDACAARVRGIVEKHKRLGEVCS